MAEPLEERPGGLALGALVAGAGTGSLAPEIAASRLLAPYFGSSTIVWANLIGIVLAALAAGYWLGGRVADPRPQPPPPGATAAAPPADRGGTPCRGRPRLTAVASGGAVAGRFYALSTAGSLLGTFVPALIAIPLVGTQRTLIGTAVLLALSGSLLLGRRALVPAAPPAP